MAVDLAFLDNEFDDFEPGKLPAKLEMMTDCKFDGVFREAKLKVLESKGMVVLETTFEVESAGKHMGQVFQHAYYITDKESAGRMGKDLQTLGIDFDQWKKANGRPFTKEIQNVPKVLPGLRFKGEKKTNKGGDRTFHNLYINGRILTDGKPERIGPKLLHADNPDDPFDN